MEYHSFIEGNTTLIKPLNCSRQPDDDPHMRNIPTGSWLKNFVQRLGKVFKPIIVVELPTMTSEEITYLITRLEVAGHDMGYEAGHPICLDAANCIKFLIQRNEELSVEVSNLVAELDTVEAEAASLEDQVSTLEVENGELEEEAEAFETRIDELETEVSELETVIENHADEIASIENDLSIDHENEVLSLREEYESRLEDVRDEMESTMRQDYESQLDDLRSEISGLQDPF
jgi:uncharacterized phage infection (PIP) family protein YhgE